MIGFRTVADFNRLYANPDPWGISHAGFRDRALGRCIGPFVAGKTVLELGCGEGHLTKTIFAGARSVTGIDISDIAMAHRGTSAAKRPFRMPGFSGYLVLLLRCDRGN